MSWRENRDLLFWYYVACTILWGVVAYVGVGVYTLLTQRVR